MEEIRATIVAGTGELSPDDGFVTRSEVEAIISRMLASLTVTVPEAEITRAQESVRAMEENSEF